MEIVYDERNGNIEGWVVFKNELGEIRAKCVRPISSTSTAWISDVRKIRKSLPKRIKAIIERELLKDR